MRGYRDLRIGRRVQITTTPHASSDPMSNSGGALAAVAYNSSASTSLLGMSSISNPFTGMPSSHTIGAQERPRCVHRVKRSTPRPFLLLTIVTPRACASRLLRGIPSRLTMSCRVRK